MAGARYNTREAVIQRTLSIENLVLLIKMERCKSRGVMNVFMYLVTFGTGVFRLTSICQWHEVQVLIICIW